MEQLSCIGRLKNCQAMGLLMVSEGILFQDPSKSLLAVVDRRFSRRLRRQVVDVSCRSRKGSKCGVETLACRPVIGLPTSVLTSHSLFLDPFSLAV